MNQISMLGPKALSILIFSPAALALLLTLIPSNMERAVKSAAVLGSTLIFLYSVAIYVAFDGTNGGLQFLEQASWLPGLGVSYSLGMDGVSLYLVLLTTLLTPIIFLSAWSGVEKEIKKYVFFMLLLETSILGAFLTLDLFLFYVFWEAMLIPMFFLIGIWGSKDRIYAAQKFLLYTFVGSIPMLVAIIYLVFQSKQQLGFYSAALSDVLRLSIDGNGMLSPQGLVFLAFSLAFAIKVPLFPLHTWLPDAHVQAPTGGSVILAGVLLKLGGYGLIRFAMPLAPAVLPAFAPWFMGVAAVAVVYGAFVALAQEDIKKLVAYSSVSHMGYVIMGLFALNQIGVAGSVYQMLNHGVSTGALFLLVGILYERTHTREIAAYSGLAKALPLYSILMVIVTFSSIALPGTNGFIGEFLILQGSFLASPVLTFVAGTGVIFGAVYMLWLCQRILFGTTEKLKSHDHLSDINLREFAYMLPLIILVFAMGLFPKQCFQKMDASIAEFTSKINKPADVSLGANSTKGFIHAQHD